MKTKGVELCRLCRKGTPTKLKPRPCIHCGREYQPKIYSSKCCGLECALRYRARHSVVVCQWCKASFKKKPGGGRVYKFCSRTCFFGYKAANKARPVEKTRVCLSGCGASVSAAGRSCQLCVERGRESKRLAALKREPRPCAECGVVFTPSYGNARLCSRSCRKARQKKLPSYAATRARLKRIHKGVRRARLRTTQVQPVDPMSVFERDGWRCQICHCATPRRYRGTMRPNAPELDHIVPLALGGAHTYTNTQCACRSCNGSKGATIAGQFRLGMEEVTYGG